MTSDTRRLVSEEIGRIVDEAANGGTSLSLPVCLRQVMQAYPDCGLNERRVTSEILIAAAFAMVAVESDRKGPG